jgi:RNA recognition motif-containing protein
MPSPMMQTTAMKRDAAVLGAAADIQAKKMKEIATANAAAVQAAHNAQLEKLNRKKKKFVRMAGGQKWEDETLNEWENDDFRLFCGDLGNEVNDELLARAFQKYPSFLKARVVRDKRTGKTKGFGFVSFKDSTDFIKAMREMNGELILSCQKKQSSKGTC